MLNTNMDLFAQWFKYLVNSQIAHHLVVII